VWHVRRRRLAQGERDRHRGPPLRARSLRGRPPRASGLLVPEVRDDGAGADAAIRRSTSSLRAPARPRPAGSGSICATSARMAAHAGRMPPA
jgi:hypothetical protein